MDAEGRTDCWNGRGWLARVPVQVYTLHGLRLETARRLLRLAFRRQELALDAAGASYCA
ncbi:MAG: hypothetical protein R2724_29590 [Bryobacterales bacterium]